MGRLFEFFFEIIATDISFFSVFIKEYRSILFIMTYDNHNINKKII